MHVLCTNNLSNIDYMCVIIKDRDVDVSSFCIVTVHSISKTGRYLFISSAVFDRPMYIIKIYVVTAVCSVHFVPSPSGESENYRGFFY